MFYSTYVLTYFPKSTAVEIELTALWNVAGLLNHQGVVLYV